MQDWPLLNAQNIWKNWSLKKTPPLNDVRKTTRLHFARDQMAWVKQWNTVVFSDGKKFNPVRMDIIITFMNYEQRSVF